MNLPPQRIYHRYLKVLVVAEALVAEVLDNFFTMRNRFCICLELDPDCIPMRHAIFEIEEKFLHAVTSDNTNPVCQVFVPNVIGTIVVQLTCTATAGCHRPWRPMNPASACTP